MDIKCRKLSCKHNNHFTCKAKHLAITNELFCEAFVEDSTKDIRDTSRCMFNEAPHYAPHRAKQHTRTACGAKCLFNEHGLCTANGLTINSVKDKPICMTYLKP